MSSENPLFYVFAMMAMSLLPFLLLSLTSFIKISVVLSILRNALGAGQLPSAAISSLLAFVLSMHIMTPLIQEIIIGVQSQPEALRKVTRDLRQVTTLYKAGSKPLLTFLRKHSRAEERNFFARLAEIQKTQSNMKKKQGAQQTNSRNPELLLKELHLSRVCTKPDAANNLECEIPGETILTLIPAFVLSELREAFAIGFTIFLPFLVIDLVVANMLVGLGMMMVSPVSISLPFKILLFVACDGWFLLCRSLVLGYL